MLTTKKRELNQDFVYRSKGSTVNSTRNSIHSIKNNRIYNPALPLQIQRGNYLIKQPLTSAWFVNLNMIFRNPFTKVIVAELRQVMYCNPDEIGELAVLVTYPDKTKHFIKGDVLQEYLTKLIFVEP